MPFEKIKAEDIGENIFSLIGKDWMLITAGDKSGFNTMTASWGGAGILWQRHVAFCFIRPQRHTRKFMDSGELFTLSFYDEKYRQQLNLCGKKSGRDTDKVALTGFTPLFAECGAPYFDEAKLVLVCRKIYADDLKKEHFLVPEIDGNYPGGDYHRMYIGEITEVLKKA